MDAEPLLKFITSLRATRQFSTADVAADDLQRVLEGARWTGSARNRQPWRFIVVHDRGRRERLSTLGAYAHHLATAPVVVAIGTNDELGGVDTAFDAGRACQNLALAAHALGLGSCPATLHPDENTRIAARAVDLGPSWRVAHVLALGHPAPAPAGTSAIPPGRHPLTDLAWEF